MAKFGLIGGRLGHSYSMGIHESYFDILGESSTYDLIETLAEELANTISRLKREGYSGLNVTIPHKVAVMDLIDEISVEAKDIGAVNTLKFTDNKIIGYNTDYYGIKKTFEKFGVAVRDKDVFILGTGGAANAVSALCKNEGGKVTFVSRTPGADAIGYNDLKSVHPNGVLINCTPVGMYPDVDASPTESVDGFDCVVDLIYNPPTTKLLKKAESCGIKAVNGLYMLVAQAVYAEAIWHNASFDEQVIDKIYFDMLKRL